ncbi:hypothetical protein Maes01_02207 [Microbulbifer aestuariivivens]|uniref:Iron-binding zinc finger CDGSH type domain-containing protein n=1 Tax=Microbulbifer aestuariivivens TaxID=1908308 RepID=A0ABP9WR12_9GAMM
MTDKPPCQIEIMENGPYIVTGAVPLKEMSIGVNGARESVRWEMGTEYPLQPRYALCRCGASANKPFCDGSHTKIGYDGEETASREPYLDQAVVYDGPTMILTDAESLCAFARYCDPHGQVWRLVEETDDEQQRDYFLQEVADCPAGRLVAWDKSSGEAVEPELPMEIGLVEDPTQQCSGPLWVRGGILVVSADGEQYEVRNRVTLCRCGASANKPFCDGSHAATHFKAK